MATSHICCIQPEDRIDSPEPPARPLAHMDGIFAAATLPDDHPHALRIPDRKANTDIEIVHSPNLTNKIKLQFRRSSLKDLKKGTDCDEDARPMTFKEVTDELEIAASGYEKAVSDQRRSGGEIESLPNGSGATSKRSSVNFSLPLGVTERMNALNNPCPGLNKSASSPTLLSTYARLPSQGGRSCSLSLLGLASYTRDQYHETDCAGEPSLLTREPELSAKHGITATSGDVSKTTMCEFDKGAIDLPHETTCDAAADDGRPFTSEQIVMLYQMDIPQQLRSMSQLSDFPAEEALEAIPWFPSFHHREQPATSAVSELTCHARRPSSSGTENAALPPGWGKIRRSTKSNASSIYSRPGSTDVKADAGFEADHRPDAIFMDWPLKPAQTGKDTARMLDLTVIHSKAEDSGSKPCLAEPREAFNPSQSSTESQSIETDDTPARLLSPQRGASSVPRHSGSSTRTKVSIASRFLERFSPPKKAVRKRRSIFQFLRPGSRKQQARSVSSPALCHITAPTATGLDGLSDDPALLTAQYELEKPSSQSVRSMSVSHATTLPCQDTALELDLNHHDLHRQPTLADYEKSLTVVGDDRRRPSTVNLQRAKEVQEDDRRDYAGLRKSLSRAQPLQDVANPLMTQALNNHAKEKACFHSVTKRRIADRSSRPEPVFNIAQLAKKSGSLVGGSLPPPSLSDHGDLLDSLEKGHLKASSEQAPISGHLIVPRGHPRGSSTATSPSIRSQVPSTIPSVVDLEDCVPPAQSKKRIGTNLESWSRYPSHSRSERCGSAGLTDAVITRDFAVDVNHEDIHVDRDSIRASNEIDSPRSKKTGKSSGQRSRFSFASTKSSERLGGIVRYYSNLFNTRGWYGQNRRTSITTGGKLEYPELEMIPPQTAESSRHGHDHSDSLFHHLRKEIEKEAHVVTAYVKEEEAKIGKSVKKEGKILGDFVRAEETHLTEFVAREEKKLGEFVKKEEDWLVHGIHRHHEKRPSSEHSGKSGSRKQPPFRSGSIFEAPSQQSSQQHDRSETMISPDTMSPPLASTDGAHDYAIELPATPIARVSSVKRTQSKAEIWSDLYRDLLSRAPSPGPIPASNRAVSTSVTARLKPVSIASMPSKPKSKLDPGTTIRRFPSVTVIDDRKGHMRSVSLISVRTGKSGEFESSSGSGAERQSTLDLLEMIKTRELEEREKLLQSLLPEDKRMGLPG